MTTSAQFGSAGKMVLALETPPWDSLYRAVVGFAVMPSYLGMVGEDGSAWELSVFFVAVLAGLRVVPAVLRRVLPFSREVKAVWVERRALAKRYDSYQWRKLFGLGLGWVTYLLVADEAWSSAWVLALACLASGVVGRVVWHKHSKTLVAQLSATAPASA